MFIIAPPNLTFIAIAIVIVIDSDVSGVPAARVAPTILLLIKSDCVETSKYHGSSHVYEYVHLVKLKADIPTDLQSTLWHKKISTGEYMACLCCKRDGNALEKSLVKMSGGQPSNGTTHLKKHKQMMDADKLAKEEEIKRTRQGAKRMSLPRRNKRFNL